jgi:hypothetical protein
VEGPNPITGSKYRNPNSETNPKKILLGDSFAGKNFAFAFASFDKKTCTVMTADSPMRMIETSKGKNPPAGALIDPMG